MDIKTSQSPTVLSDPTPLNSKSVVRSRLLPCSQSGSSDIVSIPRKKPAKVHDVRSNGWLEAMRSSSPPRTKNLKDQASEEGERAYKCWMIRYPSAFGSFHSIFSEAKKRNLVMFLDYDGTLSPIIDNPDRANLSAEMRSAVKNLAEHFPTAIISGRSRDTVYELVGLKELHYAGSHGMDIMYPAKGVVMNDTNCIKYMDNEGQEVNLFQPASEFIHMIDEIFKKIVDLAKDVKGAKVENHKFCIAVHYRNVDENSWHVLAQDVFDLLEGYPRLRLTHGRKVLEVRPMIDWDKGKALEFLLESLGFSNFQDVFPIYIGDDRTDEDAFKVIRTRNCGYGILVSSVPKESNAFFSLRDTSEVQVFLETLVRMVQQEESKDP